jgi:hypothetical protein
MGAQHFGDGRRVEPAASFALDPIGIEPGSDAAKGETGRPFALDALHHRLLGSVRHQSRHHLAAIADLRRAAGARHGDADWPGNADFQLEAWAEV